MRFDLVGLPRRRSSWYLQYKGIKKEIRKRKFETNNNECGNKIRKETHMYLRIILQHEFRDALLVLFRR
jgi:hypothetical protein